MDELWTFGAVAFLAGVLACAGVLVILGVF